MPNMNGMGPFGQGSGSGRGNKMCAGARRDLGQQQPQGFGFGMRGFCLGMRMRGRRKGSPVIDNKTALEQEANWLKQRLDWIRQRMSFSGDDAEKR